MTFTSPTPDSTCDRCWYYAGLPHLHCIQHPEGVLGSTCPGFEPDPEVEAFQAMPWVNGEPGHYNGDRIEQPEERWSDEQRLERLDWHPILRGAALNARG
ncbi:MAG: hypothetical protein WBA57_14375 [Elainellaceae cyanobacterium]